jgi:hypothetical protein
MMATTFTRTAATTENKLRGGIVPCSATVRLLLNNIFLYFQYRHIFHGYSIEKKTYRSIFVTAEGFVKS